MIKGVGGPPGSSFEEGTKNDFNNLSRGKLFGKFFCHFCSPKKICWTLGSLESQCWDHFVTFLQMLQNLTNATRLSEKLGFVDREPPFLLFFC